MKSRPTTVLTHLGLSQDTARVYLTTLKLGKARASQIAKTAKMTRTSVYPHLEELEERGLIQTIIEDGANAHVPTNPTILSTIMQEHMREVEETIPALLTQFSSVSPLSPSLRFYSGIVGMKTVLEEILNSTSKEYRLFGSLHDDELIQSVGQEYILNWSERRIAKKVFHRNLRAESRQSDAKKGKPPILIESGPHVLREIRYAPPDIRLEVLTYLFDEKVAFISGRLGKQYAAVLESKDVYESLGSVFEFLWQASKK